MLVKICGISDLETAEETVELGADFIGFLFAPSSRRISPMDAAAIAKELPSHVKRVGVFVNESIENIHYIAKLVQLDYIQLHGDESASFAKKVKYPIIKAITADQITDTFIQTYPFDFLLVDSPGIEYRGGSGETFDWRSVKDLPIERNKLLLAGGLSANNVQDAIAIVQPAGVDVSSSVETDGKKDLRKICDFIQTAKTVTVMKGS